MSFAANLSGPTPLTDAKGRAWIGVPVTRFATGTPYAGSEPGPFHTQTQLDAMTDQELAEQFSPVKLVFDDEGHAAEYRLASISADDLEAVHKARVKSQSGMNMVAYGPGKVFDFFGKVPPPPTGVSRPPSNTLIPQPTSRALSQELPAYNSESLMLSVTDNAQGAQRPAWWSYPSTQDAWRPFASPVEIPSEPLSPLYVKSPDERQFLPHSTLTTYPWPSIANLIVYASGTPGALGGGGSATMIGAYTAIGSAHSFYNKDAHAWYGSHNWQIAHIETANLVATPPTRTVSGSPQYGNCFSVTIPNSFMANNSEGDFAILDFNSCSTHPGSTWGWVWPSYSSSMSQYNSTVHLLIAYDQVAPLPPQPNGAGNYYLDPTLIYRAGQTGSMWVDNLNAWRLKYTMSTTGGASGGGVLGYLWGTGSNLYWLGNHSWGDITTGVNGGRVLTAGSWGFIQSYSTEY